jgi:hypothetical protein
MDRREFLTGMVATGLGLGTLGAMSEAEAKGNVLVIYVGAKNCPWCPSFENQKWKPFLQSPLARQVTTREVKTLSFNWSDNAEEWPADLRWVIQAAGVKPGTPKVVVMKGDKKIFFGKAGGKHWEEKVLPAIQKALG